MTSTLTRTPTSQAASQAADADQALADARAAHGAAQAAHQAAVEGRQQLQQQIDAGDPTVTAQDVHEANLTVNRSARAVTDADAAVQAAEAAHRAAGRDQLEADARALAAEHPALLAARQRMADDIAAARARYAAVADNWDERVAAVGEALTASRAFPGAAGALHREVTTEPRGGSLASARARHATLIAAQRRVCAHRTGFVVDGQLFVTTTDEATVRPALLTPNPNVADHADQDPAALQAELDEIRAWAQTQADAISPDELAAARRDQAELVQNDPHAALRAARLARELGVQLIQWQAIARAGDPR